MGNTALLKSVR